MEKTTSLISLTDFIFQKTYAEEMLTCIYACIFASCEGCQKETDHHSCSTAVPYLEFWDEAKHYFSMPELVDKMDERCEKHGVPKYEAQDLMKALRKANHEWLEQLQSMVVFLDL